MKALKRLKKNTKQFVFFLKEEGLHCEVWFGGVGWGLVGFGGVG